MLQREIFSPVCNKNLHDKHLLPENFQWYWACNLKHPHQSNKKDFDKILKQVQNAYVQENNYFKSLDSRQQKLPCAPLRSYIALIAW